MYDIRTAIQVRDRKLLPGATMAFRHDHKSAAPIPPSGPPYLSFPAYQNRFMRDLGLDIDFELGIVAAGKPTLSSIRLCIDILFLRQLRTMIEFFSSPYLPARSFPRLLRRRDTPIPLLVSNLGSHLTDDHVSSSAAIRLWSKWHGDGALSTRAGVIFGRKLYVQLVYGH